MKKDKLPSKPKTQKMLDVEEQFGESIEDLLNRLYHEEYKSMRDIANECHCSRSSVKSWMRTFGISRRTVREAMSLEESRQKKSETLKRLWQTEEYKAKTLNAMREAMSTEEFLQKRSETSKRLWQSKEYREKTIDGMRATASTTEYLQKRSETLKRLWQTEEYRTKVMAATSTDECRQKISENLKRLWRTEKYRTKIIEAISTDENRQKMSEMKKQLWQDDEFVQKVFDGWERRPNNPETLLITLTPPNVVYKGDGAFWRRLPDRRCSNPDFIVEPIKKTHQVIYFHGEYWHQGELHNRGQELIELWKEIGFECLIIWSDELYGDVNIALDRISEFIGKDTWQLSLPIA